eukprot:gene11106-3172_t
MHNLMMVWSWILDATTGTRAAAAAAALSCYFIVCCAVVGLFNRILQLSFGISTSASCQPLHLCIALVTVLASLLVSKAVISSIRRQKYRQQSVTRREHAFRRRQQFLQEARKGSTTAAKEAVKGDPEILQKGLREGKWTVYETVCASLEIALETSEAGDNSVCDVFPDAFNRARQLDEDLKNNNRSLGPLFGMPFSVKENYHYAGLDSTGGVQSLAGVPRSTTSPVVQALIEQGAVPIVRTNIPQTMLTFECSNPIYGETNNPNLKGRSPGGSSGGEAVLHFRRAVPFGLGSDIGGSVRIPANFCGTCGFKPTVSRISRRHMFGLNPGQTQIIATSGPMAPTVNGLVLAMRHLCNDTAFALDSAIPRIPFNESFFSSKTPMRIGYWKFNDVVCVCTPMLTNFFPSETVFVPPSVPCLRAVEVAKNVLANCGHTLVELPSPDISKLALLFYGIMSSDGAKGISRLVKDQDVDHRLKPILRLITAPQFIHKIASYLPENKINRVLAVTDRKTVDCLWDLHDIVNQERVKFLEEWEKAHLDGMVCISGVLPAIPQGMCSDLTPAVWPTFIFNLLNLPAGVLPVTRVTGDDVRVMTALTPNDMIDKKILKASFGSEGLPVTVQVVTAPFQEEKCLRIMKDIEQHTSWS